LLKRPDHYVKTVCDLLIDDEQKNIVDMCYPEYSRLCTSEHEQYDFDSEKNRKPIAGTSDGHQGVFECLLPNGSSTQLIKKHISL